MVFPLLYALITSDSRGHFPLFTYLLQHTTFALYSNVLFYSVLSSLVSSRPVPWRRVGLHSFLFCEAREWKKKGKQARDWRLIELIVRLKVCLVFSKAVLSFYLETFKTSKPWNLEPSSGKTRIAIPGIFTPSATWTLTLLATLGTLARHLIFC